MNKEVTELEEQIKQMDEQKALAASQANGEAKPMGIQAKLAALKEKDKTEEPQFVEDPFGVKIRGIPSDYTEEEIQAVLEEKFGHVQRIKIPTDPKDEHLEESKRRKRPMAFVTFFSEASAQKAIAARALHYDITELTIEPSMKRIGQMRERRGGDGAGGAGSAADQFKILRKD